MLETIASDDIKAARKAHICDWCSGAIEVGAPYSRFRNVYDGEMYTWKEHKDCGALAAEYGKAVDNYAYDEGLPEMREWEIDYFTPKKRQEYARIMNRAARSEKRESENADG